MYDVKKSIDVELNVQLVYIALIHEYAYEGPCRFGPPEALTQEFDLMNQAEIFKMWTQGYGGALSHIPGIHLYRNAWRRYHERICNALSCTGSRRRNVRIYS